MQKNLIRNIYLYVVSAVSLFMIVFAIVSMVNLALRTYLFPKADETFFPEYACAAVDGKPCVDIEKQRAQQINNVSAQRQRDLVNNISMLLVAIPLFAYHWTVIRRDRKETKETTE